MTITFQNTQDLFALLHLFNNKVCLVITFSKKKKKKKEKKKSGIWNNEWNRIL